MKRVLFIALFLLSITAQAADVPDDWTKEFPKADFSKHAVSFAEIKSGGPPRDGIEAIVEPRFIPASQEQRISSDEPVISVFLNGEARAYPIRIMLWHEIVNDQIGDTPIAVTYAPLYNSTIAYIRSVNGQELIFGASGRLRKSNPIMYDAQTESWWQQFTGEAIVGQYTSQKLKQLAIRVESFTSFKKRFPSGKVLVVRFPLMHNYGGTPYKGYDGSEWPFLYDGKYKGPVPPLTYVATIENHAWPIDLVRKLKTIEFKDMVISWECCQNSALDAQKLTNGKNIGSIIAQKKLPDGTLVDIPYDMPFAFGFAAFIPKPIWHLK